MTANLDLADWNRNADRYATSIAGQGDRYRPALNARLWQLLGDLRDKRVLDIGCGQGWFSSEVAARGGLPVGIDGSRSLLEHASRLYPHIGFIEADLSQGLPTLPERFDLAVAHMVVMDLPDIQPLFDETAQALEPGGSFLFTLPHPCFFQQKSHRDGSGQWYKKVTGYLGREVWRIDSFGGHNHYHRPLADYFAALSQAGLLVFEFFEPAHESNSEKVDPEFAAQFPVFLLIGARAGAA